MRRAIGLLDDYAEDALSCVFYSYVIVMIFAEVVARYVFRSSILWSQETSIYAFIWLTYISMAKLAKTRSHLAFTAIRDALPPFGQLLLYLLSDVCLLIVAVVILMYVYSPIADSIAFDQQMTGANLPLWIATAAVPFGWLLATVRIVQRVLGIVGKYRAGESLATSVAAMD